MMHLFHKHRVSLYGLYSITFTSVVEKMSVMESESWGYMSGVKEEPSSTRLGSISLD